MGRFEVKKLCPHYESCGGCDFQDLKYGRQLVEKQRWIEKALQKGKAQLTSRELMFDRGTS